MYTSKWIRNKIIPVLVHDSLHVVSGAEGDEMGVVRRRRNGNGSCATYVGVAQLECKILKNIRPVSVVIVQYMIVRRPRGALNIYIYKSETFPENYFGLIQIKCWFNPVFATNKELKCPYLRLHSGFDIFHRPKNQHMLFERNAVRGKIIVENPFTWMPACEQR